MKPRAKTIDLGDPYTSSIVLRSGTTPITNAVLTATAIQPDGTTLAGGTVTQSPSGTYSATFVLTQVGRHQIRWSGTTPVRVSDYERVLVLAPPAKAA